MLVGKFLLIQAAIALVLLGAAPAGRASTGNADLSCQTKPRVMTGITETADQKVKILADDISFPGRDVVVLQGYTQLIRGGHRVYADELIYNKKTNTVTAKGVVKFETPKGDVIRTSLLKYDIGTGKIVTGPAEFLIADRTSLFLGDGHSTVNAFGTAQQIVVKEGSILGLTDAHVTSCLDGDKDMTFTAEHLTVNTEKGIRTAERVKLRILAPDRHEKLSEALDSIE